MSENTLQPTRQFFARRTAGPGELLRLMAAAVRGSADLGSRPSNLPIDRAFIERVMLAVSQVNGCRYCLYGHTRAALAAGVPSDEVAVLLQGELGESPPEQAVALLYAQHFAESHEQPDPQARQRLDEEYGETGAARIQASIYMITLGNLVGNTFDALGSRLQGRPAPAGSLLSELSVLAIAALGVLPLGLLMASRMIYGRLFARVSPVTSG